MPVRYMPIRHTPVRCTFMMHAYEIYGHKVHAHEMYGRKVHAHETPAHHYFGGSLAQTVVDSSRSEFQNTSFCTGCEVVPIALRTGHNPYLAPI